MAEPSNFWSNCHPTLTNFRLIYPNVPAPLGIDLRQMGTATIDKVGLFPFNTPLEINSVLPNNGTVGIYMPSLSNNDLCDIGALTIYGYAYGLGVSDHVNWKSLRIIFCNSAILINGPNGSNTNVHGVLGGYTSIEGCAVGVDATVFTPGTPGIPRFPFSVEMINFEINTGFHINDSSNFLTGKVVLSETNSALSINGCKHLELYDLFAPRGWVTLASPATGVAFGKVFKPGWWQLSATTAISNVTVDGTSVAVASPARFFVPSGAVVIPTFTGTLTSQANFD